MINTNMEKYLYNFFKQKKLTDCTIELYENDNKLRKKIKMHKYILVKNSKYFKEMFKYHHNTLKIHFYDSSIVELYIKKLYTRKIRYVSTNHVLATYLFCDQYLFDFDVSDLYGKEIEHNDIEAFKFVVQKLYSANKNDNQFLYFIKKNMEKYYFELNCVDNQLTKNLDCHILIYFNNSNNLVMLDYYSGEIIDTKNLSNSDNENKIYFSQTMKKIMILSKSNDGTETTEIYHINFIDGKIYLRDLLPKTNDKKIYATIEKSSFHENNNAESSFNKNDKLIFLNDNLEQNSDIENIESVYKYNYWLSSNNHVIFLNTSDNEKKILFTGHNKFIKFSLRTVSLVDYFYTDSMASFSDSTILQTSHKIIQVFPLMSDKFIVVTADNIMESDYNHNKNIIFKSVSYIISADISHCKNFIILIVGQNNIVIFSLVSNQIVKHFKIDPEYKAKSVQFLNNSTDFLVIDVSEKNIYFYDLTTEKLITKYTCPNTIYKCAQI